MTSFFSLFSFLPAIMTSSSRMHGEFLRLLFLQTHRETTAHFNATGLPSQQNRSDNAFRFKRAAFITNPHARRILMGLKSKVGLVATKASALRINLNIQGCSVVAPSLHPNARSLSRSPSSPPPSFTQYPSPPRSLVRDGQTSPHGPRLVVSRSTCPPFFPPPPPREQLCNRYCSNKHTLRRSTPHGARCSKVRIVQEFGRMRTMAKLLLVRRRYLHNARSSQSTSCKRGRCMSRCCEIRLRIACVMYTCFITNPIGAHA
jgi:hypothetical protein